MEPTENISKSIKERNRDLINLDFLIPDLNEEILLQERIIKSLNETGLNNIAKAVNMRDVLAGLNVNNIIYRMADLFGQLQFEQSIDTTVVGLIKDEELKICLLFLVKASAKELLDFFMIEEIASKAITILNAARVPFSGMDLSKINVPTANLSYAILDGTILKGANLTEVQLEGAWLHAANVSNAMMQGANFKEWPYLQFTSSVNSFCYSGNGDYLAVAIDETIELYDAHAHAHAHAQVLRFSLKGHGDSITCVNFSPNKLQLVSGSWDKSIRLWNTQSGQSLKILEGHIDTVTKVIFSHNGLQLASGSKDKTLRFWDIQSGQCFKILEHSSAIGDINFSRDDLQLLSGGWDNIIRLWDIQSDQCLKIFEGHTSFISCIAFCNNERQLVSGSWDNTIRLWNIKDGECLKVLEGHSDFVTCIALNPYRLQLVSGSRDSEVRVWDIQTGECTLILEAHGEVSNVAFSPDGLRLICSSNKEYANRKDKYSIRQWDMNNQTKSINSINGHTEAVHSVAFSPDNLLLASGSSDCTIRFWNMQKDPILTKIIVGHTIAIHSVAFNPNNLQLATGSWDRTIKVWNIENGECLKILEGHTRDISSIDFSPNGLQLASGSFDSTIKIWDVKKGECVTTLEGHFYEVTSVKFCPTDNMILASSSYDETIMIWDVSKKIHLKTLKGHARHIYEISFSPSGSLLVSGGNDKTIKIWNVRKGTHVRTLEGHIDGVGVVSFSQDEQLLASGGFDETIKLWNIQYGKIICETKIISSVYSLCWKKTSSNRFFATGHANGSICYWSVQNKEENTHLQLLWSSRQTTLLAYELCLEGAEMSTTNLELLKQRGAIGEALKLTSEQQNNSISKNIKIESNETTLTNSSKLMLSLDPTLSASPSEIDLSNKQGQSATLKSQDKNIEIIKKDLINLDFLIPDLSDEITLQEGISRLLDTTTLNNMAKLVKMNDLLSKSNINGIIYRIGDLFSQLQLEQDISSTIFALSNDEELKLCLLLLVKASGMELRNFLMIEEVAAKAITFLNAAKVSFSGMDLSNICIPGASLQKGSCYQTNFKGSNLSQVSFVGTDLTLANLNNCDLEKVDFGILLNSNVKESFRYLFSDDFSKILIGSKIGEIIISNFRDNSNKFYYKPDESGVSNLCWCNNEENVISTHDNGRSYLINVKSRYVYPLQSQNNSRIITATSNNQMDVIAVAYKNGCIELLQYSSDNFEQIDKIQCSESNIVSLAMSIDKTLLVGCHADKIFVFINKQNTWELSVELESTENRFLQFDEKGETFVSYGDKDIIKLWNIKEKRLTKEYKEDSKARKFSVHYSYHNGLMIAGDYNGYIYLWKLDSEHPFNQINNNQKIICGVKFDVPLNIIVSVDKSGNITAYSLNSFISQNNVNNMFPNYIDSVEYCKGMQSIGLSHSGKFFVSGIANKVYLQTNYNWHIVDTYDVQPSMSDLQISSTAVNNSGNIIAIGGCVSTKKGKSFVRIIKDKELLFFNIFPDFIGNFEMENSNLMIPKMGDSIPSIIITKDDKYILFGNLYGNISAFKFDRNAIVWSCNKLGGYVTAIRCCIEKNLIVASIAATEKSEVRIFNLENGHLIKSHDFKSWINSVAINKKGTWIVVAGFDGNLYIRSINSQKRKFFSTYIFGNVLDLALNYDASIIAGACQKNVIVFWNKVDFSIHSKIHHPDMPVQIFLFENKGCLSLTSRSSSGSMRYWEYHKQKKSWDLISENGHHTLSANLINLDGVENLSFHNASLLKNHNPVGVPSEKRLQFFKNIDELGIKLYKDSANPAILADNNYTNLVRDAINLRVHTKRDVNGNTALHLVFLKKQIDKIKILLEKIEKQDKNAIKMLLIKNNDKKTVLDLFNEMQNDYPDEVRQLIEKISDYKLSSTLNFGLSSRMS